MKKYIMWSISAVLFGIGLLQLTACGVATATPGTVSNSPSSLTAARADVQMAIDLYGVAKGVALAAELANPKLAPTLAAGIAAADPIVAKAQIALNDASADADLIEALVSQIKTQANALTLQAAPSVTVVPNAS